MFVNQPLALPGSAKYFKSQQMVEKAFFMILREKKQENILINIFVSVLPLRCRHPLTVADGAFNHKIDYVIIFGDSESRRASKSQYSFKSYSNFAEWVDFAHWWSFIGKGD